MSRLLFSDLLAEVQKQAPGSVTEDRLFDLVRRLVVDSTLLAPHIRFSSETYTRSTLYRDDHFEAICLCWLPGQGTPVHNHGSSYGVIVPWEGHLACTGFRRVDDGAVAGFATLEAVSLMVAAPGSVLLDRVGSIHRLHNPPDYEKPAVSLHFYAGPLDWMDVFNLETSAIEKRPMQGEPVCATASNPFPS